MNRFRIVLAPLILTLSMLVVFSTETAHAQGENKGELVVKRAADFELTGDGTAQAWKTADWFPLTKRKGPAEYQTRAKLIYSATGIYGLVDCSDKKITSMFTEDFADLWKGDVVEIFLWTDESTPIYFEYELSPLNYELPIIVPNFDGDFFGWRPWHYTDARKTRHATQLIKDEGNLASWIAEFFIPYALLKPLENVPPKSGTKWKTNLYRVDYDEAQSSWSWQPVQTNFHDYKRFGTIVFE